MQRDRGSKPGEAYPDPPGRAAPACAPRPPCVLVEVSSPELDDVVRLEDALRAGGDDRAMRPVRGSLAAAARVSRPQRCWPPRRRRRPTPTPTPRPRLSGGFGRPPATPAPPRPRTGSRCRTSSGGRRSTRRPTERRPEEAASRSRTRRWSTDPDKGRLTTSQATPRPAARDAGGRRGTHGGAGAPAPLPAVRLDRGATAERGEVARDARASRASASRTRRTASRELETERRSSRTTSTRWDDGQYRDRVIKPAWDKTTGGARDGAARARATPRRISPTCPSRPARRARCPAGSANEPSCTRPDASPSKRRRVAASVSGRYRVETWGCQMNVLDGERMAGPARGTGLRAAPPTGGRRRRHPEHLLRAREGRGQGLQRARRPRARASASGRSSSSASPDAWPRLEADEILERRPTWTSSLGTGQVEGSGETVEPDAPRASAGIVGARPARRLAGVPVPADHPRLARSRPTSRSSRAATSSARSASSRSRAGASAAAGAAEIVEEVAPSRRAAAPPRSCCSARPSTRTGTRRRVRTGRAPAAGRGGPGAPAAALHDVAPALRRRRADRGDGRRAERRALPAPARAVGLRPRPLPDEAALRRGGVPRDRRAAPRAQSPASRSRRTSSSGFPGETEEDFEETLSLVREVRFAKRLRLPLLAAAGHGGGAVGERARRCPAEVAAERLARLLALQEEIQRETNAALEAGVSRSSSRARTARARPRADALQPRRARRGRGERARAGRPTLACEIVPGPAELASGAARDRRRPVRKGARHGQDGDQGPPDGSVSNMPVVILRDAGRRDLPADLGRGLRGERHRARDGEDRDAAADDARPPARTSSPSSASASTGSSSTEPKENTFFARIHLRGATRLDVDSRPSDAIALALRVAGRDLRRGGGAREEQDPRAEARTRIPSGSRSGSRKPTRRTSANTGCSRSRPGQSDRRS